MRPMAKDAAATLPDAVPAIKWGVAINFLAPPTVHADPKKKLEGSGKTLRML